MQEEEEGTHKKILEEIRRDRSEKRFWKVVNDGKRRKELEEGNEKEE